MSSAKFFTRFFFLVIIFLYDLTCNVDGVPLPKSAINIPRKAFRNSTRSRGAQKLTTKPMVRNPRFFGKFSILAGLGLPEAGSPTFTRNDIILDDRRPSRYSLSYNFPPKRWGPYIAAVYEPLPILSFFQNPWAYIAAALNPFNWFSSSASVTNTATSPASLLVHSIVPDKNQDDLLLLVQDPDNEIPNEDHGTVIDKIELKMEKQNFNDARLQSNINTKTPDSHIKRNDATANYVTIANDLESMDLIAEETTVKLFEEIKMDDELENMHLKASTHKMKKPKSTTISTTSAMTTNIISDTTISPTVMITEISSTTIEPNNTLSTTDQSTTPQKNSTNSYNNGYYYNGYPQNISNVEFTTKATTNSFVPVRYHNFNEINPYLQPYPTNYYNSYESQSQQSFDHYNRFEQKPPIVNDYYSRNIEFLPKSGNTFLLNGFKPSFPFHL